MEEVAALLESRAWAAPLVFGALFSLVSVGICAHSFLSMVGPALTLKYRSVRLARAVAFALRFEIHPAVYLFAALAFVGVWSVKPVVWAGKLIGVGQMLVSCLGNVRRFVVF